MGYLLFKADFNWADEIDIKEFHLIHSDSDEAKALLEISLGIHDNLFEGHDVYVGSNQEVYATEVADSLSFDEITDEEADFLFRIGIGRRARAINQIYRIYREEL